MLITKNYKLKAKKNTFNTFTYLKDINNRKLQKKIIVFLF